MTAIVLGVPGEVPNAATVLDGFPLAKQGRAGYAIGAALTASGTATLELALALVPAVVAYKVDALAAQLKFLLKVPSIVLANLVLGTRVYPEFVQEAATPENLAAAIVPLLSATPERRAQLAGLSPIAGRMHIEGASPSEAAADVVLRHAVQK